MATTRQGITGAFNGAVGPVVGYEWKGRNCMRGRVAARNPRTECQQRGRAVFGVVSRLWSRMRCAAEIGLRGVASEANFTETNIFVRLNRHRVRLDDGVSDIDYTQVCVAQGRLDGVAFGEPTVVAGEKVEVDFDQLPSQSGCNTDYVYLFAYAPTFEEGRLSLPARRIDGCVDLQLPPRWTGCEVHLYGFAWDKAFAASPSEYIGSILFS